MKFKEDAQYLVIISGDGTSWSKIVDSLDEAIEYWQSEHGGQDDKEDAIWIEEYVRDPDNWEDSFLKENVAFRLNWKGEQCYTDIILITIDQKKEDDTPPTEYRCSCGIVWIKGTLQEITPCCKQVPMKTIPPHQLMR